MSAPEGRPRKILSCASCRQRKTRCDKVQPVCSQCTRFGLECVYPSRKPTRRAPRPRQNELLDRISRLESIVERADPAKLRQLDLEKFLGSGSAGLPCEATPPDATEMERQQQQQQQDVGADAAMKYLSGEFWANLCVEVEGIKQALEQPSEDDEDEDESNSPESLEATATSTSMAPSGFLFGHSTYHQRDRLVHPSRDIMIRLWAIYTRNIDPLMKFLHRPTMAKKLQAFAEEPSMHVLDPPTVALIFSIYFAAATCLSPEQCMQRLGESQDILATRYRLSVERALAEADYLNSNALETLQAFTLYVAMMRRYSHNRNSWALTALLIRLAQAQGLHRDGDGHRFSPFVAEMRRRLWHFIVVLDVRGSEDRGSDAILARGAYNTITPTPIDDEEFSPESTGPLIPKPTPAENVICLCTAMCSGIFGFLSHPHTNAAGEAEHFIYTEDELITHIRRLENTFIHTADPNHLPSLYASEVARVVILKLWLNIQYPFTAKIAGAQPRVSRETMLRTSISIMELCERMSSAQWEDRFAWWTDTYVQWHPLAVALAELCVQPEGELANKAWAVIDRVFPSSRDKIADTATGTLWRPIKKLLKKAKAARAETMMRRLEIETPARSIQGETSIPATLPEQRMEPFQTTAPPDQDPLLAVPSLQTYDSMTMDPSYLFEYPPELLDVDFDAPLGQNPPAEFSLWNEFLNDTQMDNSPGESGGDST